MLYFDTSFLVPLLFEESTSAVIQDFMARQKGELAVSHWTRLEFSSVLAREVRMNRLDRDVARCQYPLRRAYRRIVRHVTADCRGV
jgi:uncharacterized protein